jgi:hypothetical protein
MLICHISHIYHVYVPYTIREALEDSQARATPETPRWQFLLKASRGIKKKKEVFFSTEKERGKGEKKREREREGGREE